MTFTNFKHYAHYLYNHYLDHLTVEYSRTIKPGKIHFLQFYFRQISPNDFFKLRSAIGAYLKSVYDEEKLPFYNPYEKAPGQVSMLILTLNEVKPLMTEYITFYTTDINHISQLVKEMNHFYAIQESKVINFIFQSQLQVIEREKKINMLLSGNSQFVTIVFDKGYNVTHWNKVAEEATGLSAIYVIGKNLFQYFAGGDEIKRKDIFLKILNGTKSDIKNLKFSVSETIYDGEVFPVSGLNNESEGGVIILKKNNIGNSFNNVQEYTSIQSRNLKEKELILKYAYSEMEHFVNCAHQELKAPVVNIEGLLNELMFEVMNGGNEVDELNKMIVASVAKVKKTIESLVEIADIFNADFSVPNENINVLKLLEESLNDLEPLLVKVNLKVLKELEISTILFSKKHLKTLFVNLFTNSIKFRSDDNVEVMIRTERCGDYVKLSFCNIDKRISSKDQSKFFQSARNTYDHFSGMNGGLYLVKNIIEKNQGMMEVTNEHGHQTTYHMYFKSNNQPVSNRF